MFGDMGDGFFGLIETKKSNPVLTKITPCWQFKFIWLEPYMVMKKNPAKILYARLTANFCVPVRFVLDVIMSFI
ncbi:hypothetical protein [Methylovulum psychrotolerans]|uniref:Uncharacterized protein n=1 Tax=Methylovulum psychrotolerans TaxID=1704499 RepID=A0A2S5CI54_9GAMM|nr:hypothetical protein [Methylovulum psychrotolerans]POZ50412.1 hypothetical protein AADEFJLK_03825 [Methylovulum psychrotolerans]